MYPELRQSESSYPDAAAALFAAGFGQHNLERVAKVALSLKPEEVAGAKPKASHEGGGATSARPMLLREERRNYEGQL